LPSERTLANERQSANGVGIVHARTLGGADAALSPTRDVLAGLPVRNVKGWIVVAIYPFISGHRKFEGRIVGAIRPFVCGH